MSLDYTICFRSSARFARLSQINALHSEFGIRYKGARTKFMLEDTGSLSEQKLPAEQWDPPENELESTPLIARFSADQFAYTIGFIDTAQHRYCLLDISSRGLDHFATFLREMNSDFLRYLVRMQELLGMEAMVMGLDCTFDTLVSCLDGSISPSDIEEYIMVAISCPKYCEDQLSKYGGKDVPIGNTRMITRWLPSIQMP